MKQKIYFIPGMGQNCGLVRYKKLVKAFEDKGYEVKCVNPDWYSPISEQIFPIERNSIVCGFSMGAVIAYLVAKKYSCKKAIFGSISPLNTFSKADFKEIEDFLCTKMDADKARKIVLDMKNIKLNLKSLKCPFVTFAGIKENDKADYLVPRTGHKMTDTYIKYILRVL